MEQSRLFTFPQTLISTTSKDRLLSVCKIVEKKVLGLVLEKQVRNAELQAHDSVPLSKALATKCPGRR